MGRTVTRFLVCSMALGFAACGGGQSGGGLGASATFNLQAGYATLVALGQSNSVNLSGTASNGGVAAPFTGTGTLSLGPATMAVYNMVNVTAQTLLFSGTVSISGQTGSVSAQVTDYYETSTPSLLVENAGTEFDVARAPIVFPTMVMSGSGGVLGTLDRYTDSTLSTAIGTMRLSYSCLPAAASGVSIPVLVTIEYYDMQNALKETDVYRYTLTSVGNLLLTSISFQSNSGPDSMLITVL